MSLAKLILAEPFKPTRHVLIDKNPFLIGRNSDCDLVMDRPGISKHHAEIHFDGEQFKLTDLESKNGTLINGELMRQTVLKDRDLITMGGLDFHFQTIARDEFSQDLESNRMKFKLAMEFTRAINSHDALDPILDEIMNSFMRLSQGERGFLLLENEQRDLEMRRSVGIATEELSAEKFKLSMTAIDRAVQEKQSVAISNALDDSYFGFQTSVQQLELRTLVCVPILLENRAIGVFYADNSQKPQEFTHLDVEVLESLAANAGIAIQNALLNQDIMKLIHEASSVLKELEEKTHLDSTLQVSVQNTLDSISFFKEKRSSGEKRTLASK